MTIVDLGKMPRFLFVPEKELGERDDLDPIKFSVRG